MPRGPGWRRWGPPRGLYDVACDPALAWARVARRNAGPGALFVARKTFDLLRARVEPLGEDEPHETVTDTPAQP
jgi:hypothetical protein